MKAAVYVLWTIAALAVAGCGNTATDRALSGGAIGAGAGVASGAILGGNLLTGGLVGGLVGGTAGALTDQEDINLGEPVWE